LPRTAHAPFHPVRQPVISLMLLYLHLVAFARHLNTELDKKIAAIQTEPHPDVIAA
jgi:hypothetical protein